MPDNPTPSGTALAAGASGFRGPVSPPLLGDNVYHDADDPNLLWYLPDLSLIEPDASFQFAATQSVDAAGQVFDEVKLSLTVQLVAPAELTQAQQQFPAARFQQLGSPSTVELTVPFKDSTGALQNNVVQGVSAPSGGTLALTFTVEGAVAIQAYLALALLGGASLRLHIDYTLDHVVPPPPPPGPDRCAALAQAVQDLESIIDDPDIPATIKKSAMLKLPGAQQRLRSCRTTRAESVQQHQANPTIALTTHYAGPAYGSRFTISSGGVTRPIIDVNDLSQFVTARSEYRELTSLGDVQARYPSLRRLYLGQVSGTVVAVPAGYGIVHGAAGVAATCDSIVDDSPVSITGCRFHFTFTLAPVVDPIDLAQLAADLLTIPEAVGRTVRPTLPVGLDPRHPANLDGFPAATAVFTDGVAPHTVQVGVDIADASATPAITNVNLFLLQLASTGPAPLFANLAVRLDDLFPEQVQTQASLNLYRTAESDDLTAAVLPGTPPAVQLTNTGPLPLTLHRLALVGPAEPAVSSLGEQTLTAGASRTLGAGPGGTGSVVVSRSLAVPVPLRQSTIFDYLTFHTETVQQVQHPLTVNAAGVDFAAAAITAIDITFTVTAAPLIVVPTLTLTPSHKIDFVHVMIPIAAAVTGLGTTVTLTASTPTGQRTTTLTHDFVDDPTLILTASTLT